MKTNEEITVAIKKLMRINIILVLFLFVFFVGLYYLSNKINFIILAIIALTVGAAFPITTGYLSSLYTGINFGQSDFYEKIHTRFWGERSELEIIDIIATVDEKTFMRIIREIEIKRNSFFSTSLIYRYYLQGYIDKLQRRRYELA